MNMNTIIMLAVLVALAVVLVVRDGPRGVLEGLKAGGRTIANTWILILIAIAIGGFLTVLVPTELISRYIGGESGFKGLLIGWKFSLLRLLSAFFLPILGGLIAIGISKILGLFPG